MAKIIDGNNLPDGPLPEALRRSFHENGFLHFRSFLNADAVAQLWKAVEAVQAKWVAEDIKVVNGTPIKWGHDVDGNPIVQRFASKLAREPAYRQAG